MPHLIDAAADYAANARGRNRPAQVSDLALMNLVDWFSVTIGARHAPAALKVAEVVAGMGMSGPSPLFTGGTSAPMGAALVNGTMAHCLDYDDLHFPSLSHLSAPTWAAVMAVAPTVHADERTMVDAFLAGFEIAARLGDNGMGKAVTDRGWHSTGVHGRLSAAIAASVLLNLDTDGIKHAIAIAATQTSGLTTSFGTMAKPFHAGKAAADGVLAAQLAATGFEGAVGILDDERNLASALVQDGTATMRLEGLGERWEIENNALKPYACCGLTHAPIDCARQLFDALDGRDIAQVDVQVHPLATKVANQREPVTPLAGKFSLSYCVALGLRGFHAIETDFVAERLADSSVQSVERNVTLHAVNDLEPCAARMAVQTTTGDTLDCDVPMSLGNPQNPMSWTDLENKFMPLVTTELGAAAGQLFSTLRGFEQPGALDRTIQMTS
jgi:2-methylcitrate dehydratase PrpD